MASPSSSSSSKLTLDASRDTYFDYLHPNYLNASKYPGAHTKSATDFPANPATNASSNSSGSCSSYISGDSYSDADGEGDDDDDYGNDGDYVEDRGDYATVVPVEYYEAFMEHYPDAPYNPPADPNAPTPPPLPELSPDEPRYVVAGPSYTRPAPQETRAGPATDLSDGDSDSESESESDGDGTEDEYVPSPAPTSRKRRAASQLHRESRSPSPAARDFRPMPRHHHTAVRSSYTRSPSPPAPLPIHSSNRQRSRAKQVDGPMVIPEGLGTTLLKCPHCGFVQKKRSRGTDLNRHFRTHFRQEASWVCWGVPEEDARRQGLEVEKVYTYNGRYVVGGCGESFSRQDALKRHLKVSKGCHSNAVSATKRRKTTH